MDTIEVSGFDENSITDGPGLRFTVFAQGCVHHCKGCHNPETHKFGAGTFYPVTEIYEKIRRNPIIKGVTFSGGEPFCQPEGFLSLAKLLKQDGYEIAAYSGYTWQQLTQDPQDVKYQLLSYLDILVDSPFVLELRTLSGGFRGSSNQRIINVPLSLQTGQLCLETSPRWLPGQN